MSGSKLTKEEAQARDEAAVYWIEEGGRTPEAEAFLPRIREFLAAVRRGGHTEIPSSVVARELGYQDTPEALHGVLALARVVREEDWQMGVRVSFPDGRVSDFYEEPTDIPPDVSLATGHLYQVIRMES